VKEFVGIYCAINLIIFMPTNDSELQTQARKILDAIAFTPFELPNLLTTSRSQRNSKAMQAKLLEQLYSADAEVILECLPERIRSALIARATEIEYMAFT
jgi:hypothetical protein